MTDPDAIHSRRLHSMLNAGCPSEWVCRALLGLPVDLDEWQERLLADYRDTEHARTLKRSLIAKGSKNVPRDSRSLSRMRLENAGHETDSPDERSRIPRTPLLPSVSGQEDRGTVRTESEREEDRESAFNREVSALLEDE